MFKELKNQIDQANPEQLVDLLFGLYLDRGQSKYDEAVTQIDHALQCAYLAREKNLDDCAVTAALLHDLGHLMLDEATATKRFLAEDLNHEEVGATLLKDRFPAAVIEPIRMHVGAKRYLCTTDDTYWNCLSDASKRSLVVQGGKLSDEELAEFQKSEYLDTALEIRRFDDMAKEVGLDIPPIEDYRSTVMSAIQ